MKLSQKQIRAINAKYPNSLELSKKRKPHIAVHEKTNTMMVVSADGLSDFPLYVDMSEFHKPNKVLYDHPERVPQYIRKDAQRILELKK